MAQGTAYNRDTKFELLAIKQVPNGLEMLAVDRGVANSRGVALELREGQHIDQALIDKIVGIWTELENLFAQAFDEHASKPQRKHDLVNDILTAQAQLAELHAKIEAAKSNLGT